MTPEERLAEARASTSDQAAFQVVRDAPDPDPRLSFSAEALDALHDEIMVWIGGRILAAWDATGQAPQTLQVVVRVRAK